MLKVSDIMTKNVIACEPETSLQEAARLMYFNNISALPVLDKNDQVVGIISEADIIKKQKGIKIPEFVSLLGSLVYLDNPLNGDEIEKQLKQITAVSVKELMSNKPITVSPEDEVAELASLMVDKKLKTLPVVRGGKLAGVVSRSDIVKLIADVKNIGESGGLKVVKE